MRTTVRAAVLLLVATTVIGCGRGDGTEEVAVVRELDLLQAVETAGTARISLVAEVDLPVDEVVGGVGATRLVAESEGVIDVPGGRSSLTGSTEVVADRPAGAVDQPVTSRLRRYEQLTVDGATYVRTWSGDAEPGAWAEVPDAGDLGPASGAERRLDPQDLLRRIREAATTLTEVGPDDVRGDATTQYRATVDADALGEDFSWGADDADEVGVDVWVDGEDRLRRVTAGGVTLELWDFGVEVDLAAPTDLAEGPDAGSLDGVFPEVTGPWAAQATGTTDGSDWTIFAAPASFSGAATTCRTLEVASDDDDGGGFSLDDLPGMMGGDFPLPNHDGAIAVCGSGLASMALTGFVADPALQVLVPLAQPDLLALVVSPRFAGGPVTLVPADGEPLELDLDATGAVVVTVEQAAGLTAIELDGGAVRCPVPDLPGAGAGATWASLGIGPGPCVRT